MCCSSVGQAVVQLCCWRDIVVFLFPTVSLWIWTTLVLAGSQSPTDSAHSCRRKLTWQQFSLISMIWTGLLNCTTDTKTYARDGQTTCNEKQEKGKEKDVCLLRATQSRVSSDEMRPAGSCWYHTAVFLHTALFHTFPPSVLPRMFLSVQKRIIWMSFTRVRSPAFV